MPAWASSKLYDPSAAVEVEAICPAASDTATVRAATGWPAAVTVPVTVATASVRVSTGFWWLASMVKDWCTDEPMTCRS